VSSMTKKILGAILVSPTIIWFLMIVIKEPAILGAIVITFLFAYGLILLCD